MTAPLPDPDPSRDLSADEVARSGRSRRLPFWPLDRDWLRRADDELRAALGRDFERALELPLRFVPEDFGLEVFALEAFVLEDLALDDLALDDLAFDELGLDDFELAALPLADRDRELEAFVPDALPLVDRELEDFVLAGLPLADFDLEVPEADLRFVDPDPDFRAAPVPCGDITQLPLRVCPRPHRAFYPLS